MLAALVSLAGVYLMYLNTYGADAAARADPNSDQQAYWSVDGPLPLEFAVLAPLFLLVTVPVLWRSRAPVGAAAAALAGLLVNYLLTGTDVVRCGVVMMVALLLAFASGARCARREALLGLALTLTLTVSSILVEIEPEMAAVLGAVTAATWAVGRLVRSRQTLIDELETETAELHRAREERARLEVANDRSQLSRALDEQLQHRLGELARRAEHAGDPATTLVEIEHESRQTLEATRDLVGVLREDAPIAPQPALTALIDRAQAAGAHVAVEGNPRALPPGVELSAYRIVEHLLSALDGAPGVEVGLRFGDDALGISVSGPARRRAKPAIELARQRVRLHHGTLVASTRGGRTDAVAQLPVLA